MSFDKAKPIDNTVLVNNRKSFKRIEKQSIYSKVFYTADNFGNAENVMVDENLSETVPIAGVMM